MSLVSYTEGFDPIIAPASTPLPAEDLRTRLEQQIREGLDEAARGFARVAEALAQVRDLGLYKSTHGTFEAYCEDVWERSGRWARYHIAGYVVLQNLRAILQSGTRVPLGLPEAEAQVRPLAHLPAEAQAAAWADAVETAGGAAPTQAQVEAAARRERARMLVRESKYALVTQRMHTGALGPEDALKLVTALDQCAPSLRPAILALEVSNPSIVLELNRLGRERRESFEIVTRAKTLQFADETCVPIAAASPAQLRAWLDERSEEHRRAALESAAEPVSVVVFPADARATLRELRRVMNDRQLQMLAEAITDDCLLKEEKL